MTSNMSAATPISSVIAVEGVSGEIATPAFIPRPRILEIRGSGLAGDVWMISVNDLEVGP